MIGRQSWLGLLGAVVIGGLAACGTGESKEGKVPPLDLANLDTTCLPCNDFNQFANGGWIANNPIPDAYAQWGSFHELRDRSTEMLYNILDSLAVNKASLTDPTTIKLAAFYESCMDTVTIEELGLSPVKTDLALINALSSPADIKSYISAIHAKGAQTLFTHGSSQDSKNSSEVILWLGQGGLGLPDRDYYLKTDSTSRRLLKEYGNHIANLLVLAGESRATAETDAKAIIELETTLAEMSMSRVDRRNPELTYNKKDMASLKALTPGFDWEAYFAEGGIPSDAPANVAQPVFFAKLDRMFTSVEPAVWKAYLKFHLLSDAAPRLNKAFEDENFDFFERKLTGAKEQLPRYKRCVQAADRMLGHAVGKEYVTKHFPPEAKASAMAMVHNLKEAFRERLTSRSWMSDSTREQAFTKLNSFNVKIGYPDKWMDYTTLDIKDGESYYKNYSAARLYLTKDDVQKIGKPVDRDYWWMTPPTVNAYYSATMNEIVFPAGILQPPFFDPNADDAVNYGGMGAVIGHEISHGFDDKGSMFDEKGNLRQWFTSTDLSNFKRQTQLVQEQYDGYTILDSIPVNGALTLGENIADLGGVQIAYVALKNTLAKRPNTDLIDGLTPEQRFFLAWAQIWRGNIRDEMARVRITTDTHSPQRYRVNGPLSNLPEFAEAWGCKEGDPMVRSVDKRAEIW